MHSRMKINILAFVLCALILQSCSTGKEILYMQDASQYNNTKINYTDATIQPNDILKVTIGALIPETAIPYNKITANSVQANNVDVMRLEGYLVSSNSTISLPILGEVSILGETTETLELKIVEMLEKGGHLVNPSVIVRLMNAKVTILGEVNQPGTYSFTEKNITFLQALGLAGDLTIKGKREDIMLIREVDGVRTVSHINITKSDWFDTEAYYIKPNDVIVVNPNNPKVKSAGFIGDSAAVLTIASLVLSTAILLTR